MANVGFIVVLFHFLLYYGIPALQCYLLPQTVKTTFVWVPLSLYGLTFLVVAVAWTWGLAQANLIGRLARFSWPRPARQVLASLWMVYPYIRIILALIILAFSAVFAGAGLFFYRYSGESLGQSLSPVVGGLVILHAWSMADFLLIVLAMLGNRDFWRGLIWRIPTLIIAVSWLLAINGSASAIYGGLYLYLAILPGMFRKQILVGMHSDGKNLSLRKVIARCTALLLLVAVMFVSWQTGNIVKTSATTPPPSEANTQIEETPRNQVEEMSRSQIEETPRNQVEETPRSQVQETPRSQVQETPSGWSTFSPSALMAGSIDRLLWLPSRLGVAGLYSFSVITNKVDDGVYTPSLAWSVIGRNVQFRWSTILHLPAVQRPEIRSIGQLNYRNVENPALQNDRSGASPGLLAAASYLAPRPFDIVLALAYISLICVAFARVTGPGPQGASIIGYILLVIMARELFLNVADYLLIADGGFVFFISFMVLAEAANAGRTVRASTSPEARSSELPASGV